MIRAALLLTLTLPFTSYAEVNKMGCFPRSPDAAIVLNSTENVTEAQRDLLFRSLISIYSQDVALRGETLKLYETDTMDFGAFASHTGNSAGVEMYKGTRFHRLISPDSYALIVCHELGHHLGGQPLSRTGSWATVEGGADYFGNLKCMRRYLESLPPGDLFVQPAPALELIARCETRFSNGNEVQVCARSLAAARQLGMVLSDLAGHAQTDFPSLDKSDSTVVQSSLESHPQSQCRVDTYRAAALCPVPWSEALNNDDVNSGACHAGRNPEDRRPACWFAGL